MVGVVTFPGSNGDHNALYALRENIEVPVRLIEHRETDLGGADAVILPIGFSDGSSLLGGAVVGSRTLRFHCHWEKMGIEGRRSAWTNGIASGQVLRLPMAQGKGAYEADDATLH